MTFCLAAAKVVTISHKYLSVASTWANACLVTCLAFFTLLGAACNASENVPHRAFAQWAEIPEAGQLVAGLVYEESEAYHIWAGHNQYNVTQKAGGENYGIDINQGYVALQYGLTDRWAADLNVGYTTAGWRYFSGGAVSSTTGLMDIAMGVRYQVYKENEDNWLPTLTLRAGGILPGSYNQNFPFAPGLRSAGIEPEILLRKHFGWAGFGAYADALFRWNRTTGNDQYITVIGLLQQIKGWELAAGYRHLQTISGNAIEFTAGVPSSLHYPRDVRENNDSIEAGFSYSTAKRHIRYGFHSRTVFDGSNTDRKFWFGGSVDIPLSILSRSRE